jgi:hypothetical protein
MLTGAFFLVMVVTAHSFTGKALVAIKVEK